MVCEYFEIDYFLTINFQNLLFSHSICHFVRTENSFCSGLIAVLKLILNVPIKIPIIRWTAAFAIFNSAVIFTINSHQHRQQRNGTAINWKASVHCCCYQLTEATCLNSIPYRLRSCTIYWTNNNICEMIFNTIIISIAREENLLALENRTCYRVDCGSSKLAYKIRTSLSTPPPSLPPTRKTKSRGEML